VRYDAVIFDLFGTLISLHTVSPAAYEAMLRQLAENLDVPFAAFRDQWRAAIEERESGALGSVDDILRTTAAAVGGEPTTAQIAAARESWLPTAAGWLTPRADAAPTMAAFREAGCKIGLLSNCSAEVPPLWRDDPLAAFVDEPVFSCEVGLMKPDARLYAHACGLLNVAPERCLYVGDGGAHELTGARSAGMDALLLRVPGEEDTWFDENFRLDALGWTGPTVASLGELRRYAS
jgi:putative hydrolase of the HAD superfamily